MVSIGISIGVKKRCVLARIVILCVAFYTSCSIPTESSSETIEVSDEEGKRLLSKWCQSCHLVTPPDILPRHIWEKEILPKMGAFNGIYENKPREAYLEGGEAKQFLIDRNIYPEAPVIDSISWLKIKKYILDNAPVELQGGSTNELEVKEIFDITPSKDNINPPMSSMVQYISESGLIYHGDVKGDYSTLNIFTGQGEILQSLAMKSPPVEVRLKEEGLWALLMGSFTSSESPTGSIVVFSKEKKSPQYNKMEIIIDKLQRPVDMEFADLDNDGDEDIIVAEFGNWTGQVTWFENTGNQQYSKHPLIISAGSTKIISDDINKDGLIDLLVMVTQADESIYALINEGNKKFSQQRLIQLPPTHGSVYFDYADINGDGIKDIIHVSGDNADYTAILKPYHGVRIYLGNNSLSFKEDYFYPIHGPYKAIPLDFDSDGDIDIAAISFFPDYSSGGKESLMMLENNSTDSLSFSAFTISGYDQGRWNVMSAGDVNNDGMQDLILGSFVIDDPYKLNKPIRTTEKKYPMLLILKNKKDK